MDRWLIDTLTVVSPAWLYAIVGVLTTAESVLFGLFLPGELVLLLAGFLSFHGQVNLTMMLIITATAAVGGYLLGYEVGRRFGSGLRTGTIGRRIGEARWSKVDAKLAGMGGRAILLGRLVGLLRAIMPVAAGMTRMPYRTFLLWAAAGGLVWAPAFVLIGYTVGGSYEKIAGFVGSASMILLLLVVLLIVLFFAVRRFTRRNDPPGSVDEPQ
ncbi:DedA family protein [Spongiactinospora sp. 9N601]|uniref:DedA family protein n=1 Tax=Spongiactinospora sp. 9N601 TaxID=3375149 RepID=UPI00378EFDBB